MCHAQTLSGAPPGTPAAHAWPVQDGSFDVANFRCHDGETLPSPHLHDLTLGTLHRDAEGHADNAILLLHGTGGSARSLLNPVFSTVLFGPGQALDITKYFLYFDASRNYNPASRLATITAPTHKRRFGKTTWSIF